MKKEWLSMDTADKSGMPIWIRCIETENAYIGRWDASGTSRVGNSLEVTGFWRAQCGWFQPDEINGWCPLNNYESFVWNEALYADRRHFSCGSNLKGNHNDFFYNPTYIFGNGITDE